ncbi:hypothetical protein EXIGLDRAFT_176324 [Exidia glandulosa HHB12029]|uniref:Uncharacterized protein n=1 Tax=Exidia glandulosa HHB12029 TaxID=1314781 RepID=A0A166BDB3_EXIGL|nr:hypothetical protein EXIGLDRAFT_176324 [Exidia glandulosa HHB12029]
MPASLNFGPQMNFIAYHNDSGKSAPYSAHDRPPRQEWCDRTRERSEGFHQGGHGPSPRPDPTRTVLACSSSVGSRARARARMNIMPGRRRKVVSTKSSELNAVCDLMNIQVHVKRPSLATPSARQRSNAYLSLAPFPRAFAPPLPLADARTTPLTSSLTLEVNESWIASFSVPATATHGQVQLIHGGGGATILDGHVYCAGGSRSRR